MRIFQYSELVLPQLFPDIFREAGANQQQLVPVMNRPENLFYIQFKTELHFYRFYLKKTFFCYGGKCQSIWLQLLTIS